MNNKVLFHGLRWLCFAFVLAPATLFAQTASLQGTVTDPAGEPLPGANVFIVELGRGASADVYGRYDIQRVPEGTYNVRYSYISYKTVTRSVTVGQDDVVLDVRLEADMLGLQEVVVTAMGIERERRSIGYAMQNVSGDDIVQAREPNIVSALAGKVAGVQVSSSSGQPGQSSRIVIRGNSSMLGNNQPLFVIDGVPMDNSEYHPIDNNIGESMLFTGGSSNRGIDIDPNIIEDISVLKGASATALYGSRAANGVIVITTKNAGRRGPMVPRIQVSSTVGSDDARIEGFQMSYLQGVNGNFINGLPANRGGYAQDGGATQGTRSWGPHKDAVPQDVLTALGVDRIETFDPRRQFYQTGLTLDNSISVSGATEQVNYMLSFSNLQQSGIVPNSDLERNSVRANFAARFGDDLDVNTSVNYVNTFNNWMTQGNSRRAYVFTLNHWPISFDLDPRTYDDGTQRVFAIGVNNPLWLTDNNFQRSEVNRFLASTTVNYRVLPWLTVSERIGIDTYVDTGKDAFNVGTASRAAGAMADNTVKYNEINSDLMVSVQRAITPDVSANVLVGNNINARSFRREWIQGLALDVPGYFHVGNASFSNVDTYDENRRLFGVYTQATLDYRDMVYLTLTARNDWSSTLPKGQNSYFYPSASVGFVFTEALNISEDLIPFGKVRLAVGRIGNDAPVYSLATRILQAEPSDGQRGIITYPFGGINGYLFSTVLGNADLRPERTTEYEAGIDLMLLDGRLGLDLAYYDRSTRDQIFQVPVSGASGFPRRIANAGEIRNYGVEAILRGRPIRARNMGWDVQVNFSKNTTEVVSLAPGVNSIYLAGFTDPQIRIMEGKGNYGVIWSNRHLRNEAGELLIGDDGYPIVAPDLGPIGNVMPDWLAGIRNTFTYAGVSLSALVDIRQGGDVMNMDQYYNTFYGTAKVTEQRGATYVWDGVNVNTGERNTKEIVMDQAYFTGPNPYVWMNVFENHVEDGSYIKLREVSLAYTLPRSLMGRTPFQGVQLSATGRNLWLKSNFSYGDPEGSLYGSGNGQGFYHNVTPATRSLVFNVQLTM